jgi:excinuclease UvrABC nuclease subunit
LSVEQFQEWVNRRSNLPLAVKGHTFTMRGNNVIVVDGGKFLFEEAQQLVKLLNSNNPLAQLNAALMISERNGSLRVVVLILVALIIVAALFLALR